MRSLVMQLFIVLVFAHATDCQDSATTLSQAKRRVIPYTKSRGTIVGVRSILPDSLGGRHVIGYVNMDVRVTKDGRLHGYRVNRIEVSPDTLSWFVYSANRQTRRGDSLYAMFRPWLDSYYGLLRSANTGKDSLFLLWDTLWYNHIVDFGSVRNPRPGKKSPSLTD
jgi:hypothetical protein